MSSTNSARTTSARFLFIALLGALTLVSIPASAFCRTTTASAKADEECNQEGMPLYFPLQTLRYRIVPSNGPIPTEVLAEKTARAFAKWTAPNEKCTPGISVIEETTSSSDKDGVAEIRVVTTLSSRSASELALTNLIFGQSTGAIHDLGLELKVDSTWSASDVVPPKAIDLEGVLTHEIGHVLGLAHSSDPRSAMFATSEPGTADRRTLSADDMDAICAIYPNKTQRLSGTGLVPSSPCSSLSQDPARQCADSSEADSGCSTTRPQPRGLSSGSLLAVAIVALAGVFRRRRRATVRQS